jgi:hypothetical protein
MTYEWRYPIGSKTQGACAYPVDAAADVMSICGVGWIKRATRPLACASPKRIYPVGFCAPCHRMVKEQGLQIS